MGGAGAISTPFLYHIGGLVIIAQVMISIRRRCSIGCSLVFGLHDEKVSTFPSVAAFVAIGMREYASDDVGKKKTFSHFEFSSYLYVKTKIPNVFFLSTRTVICQ